MIENKDDEKKKKEAKKGVRYFNFWNTPLLCFPLKLNK